MARPSHPLAPLHIPHHIAGPQFNQQPYSPALPSALQPGFQHQFPHNLPMHTPMQPFFPHQPPLAPVRPSHHHSASLAPTGIHQAGIPITPLGGHFPRPSLAGPPFPNRNRRQPSIGGPPKAVLGGPSRKLSPLPPPAPVAPAPKTKKVIVNLPRETVLRANGEPSTRPSWARTPVNKPTEDETDVVYPELDTRVIYPPEEDYILPPTIDVFLPGKALWEPLKNRVIEEKLGVVEKISGSTVPHIFAPHARAASISSPADPALLFFKLNKLQQSQAASASNSNNVSPQPPFMTPSPQFGGQFYATTRHGHSLSLAQTPSIGTFGPDEVFGDHAFETTRPSLDQLQTLQTQPPFGVLTLAPYANSTRPSSRPDFNLGFGLDIPEEEEPEEEAYPSRGVEDRGPEADPDTDVEAEQAPIITPAIRSTVHSRHVSKLSAALSLISVGGLAHESLNVHRAESDIDAVAEWTGSEDLYMSDDSIGEWSNPSDEERARQERVERRSRRRAALAENEPRRLPNFPRPPENTAAISAGRDDDVISNPSDDDLLDSASRYSYLGVDLYHKSSPSTSSVSARPLPPLPHSRVPSGQFSIHDPAQAHSRTQSIQDNAERISGKKLGAETLNPLAKPFVFGTHDSIKTSHSSAEAESRSHVRLPTFGKPLSAAAAEFKPIGFTFRPPAGVPQLSFPNSATSTRPLPEVPEPPVRAQQGREKRQRRGSSSSVAEGDSMMSFRFPAGTNSPPRHVESPESMQPQRRLNPAAPVFKFGGNLSRDDFMSKENIPAIQALGLDGETLREDALQKDDSLPKMPMSRSMSPDAKTATSPIGLDYRHPVSQNTVPAGLFKALVNGDERTRRTVRSRLGSREFFETLRRPSLDDLHMDSMSRSSRQRLITDPGAPLDDVFGPNHMRRRSSLPNSLHTHSPTSSLMSADSNPAMDLTGRFEQNKYEDKLEAILDRKISSLRQEFSTGLAKSGGAVLSPATEAMIKEVVSLFRFQLQESAARGLDESHFEARSEIDFAMFKDVVQQGNGEALRLIQTEIKNLTDRVGSVLAGSADSAPLTSTIKEMCRQTIESVKTSIAHSTISYSSLGHDITNQITPALASLRPEPIDYELLTARLSQAVKPHISQLIDLASDKRETAGLIVDRLIPLLPRNTPPEPPFDIDALTLQLTTEIRRAIAPIDAFEIKEQVADLVVERLDSRLSVRDKALNTESVSAKVAESIAQVLEPISSFMQSDQSRSQQQQAFVSNATAMLAAQSDTLALLRQMPAKFDTVVEQIQDLNAAIPIISSKNLDDLKATLDDVKKSSDSWSQGTKKIHSNQDALLEELRALPTRIEQNIQSIVHTQRDQALPALAEVDELRKLNAEYQSQLAKARGAHGQVRVEKDAVEDRLKDVDADRERLRSQVKELQSSLSAKTSDAGAWETKAFKLEQALAQALSRLQAADVEQQSNRERISTLENTNKELSAENLILSSKVDNLDARLSLAAQGSEAMSQNYAALQSQHSTLLSQHGHWEEFRRTADKVEQLSALFNQSGSHEPTELRQARDRSKAIEAEHQALQRRLKDLEGKASQSDKLLAGTRQSLAQSQQRCTEWEKRAKEFEGQLEMTRTKLDQSEQRHSQLETDYSLTKMQLDEKEADDRLAKDQERQQREQMTALENKVKTLQAELQNKLRPPLRNGVHVPHAVSRPDSRASTVLVNYSDGQVNSVGTATPPNQPSVWDSIHAPSTNGHVVVPHTPIARRSQITERTTPKPRTLYDYRSLRNATASPTPSVVSVAPTLGDDGWWA